MSASVYTTGRNTHIKIVAVSIVAAIAVALIGLNARPVDDNQVASRRSNGPVVKAGQPVELTVHDVRAVR